jgi:hypothetical protein
MKRNRTGGLLPPPPSEEEPEKKSSASPSSPFSSLLPPPLPGLKSAAAGAGSPLSSGGLSSWEEFLGRADFDSSEDNNDNNKRLLPQPKGRTRK